MSGGRSRDRIAGGGCDDLREQRRGPAVRQRRQGLLSGGSGRDRLRGGAGRDRLRGNSGRDGLNGGAGHGPLQRGPEHRHRDALRGSLAHSVARGEAAPCSAAKGGNRRPSGGHPLWSGRAGAGDIHPMNYVRWMPRGIAAGAAGLRLPVRGGATDYCVDAARLRHEERRDVPGGPRQSAADWTPTGSTSVEGPTPRSTPRASSTTAPTGRSRSSVTGERGPSGEHRYHSHGSRAATGSCRLIGGPGTAITNLRIHQPPNAASGLRGLGRMEPPAGLMGETNGQQNAHYGVPCSAVARGLGRRPHAGHQSGCLRPCWRHRPPLGGDSHYGVDS